MLAAGKRDRLVGFYSATVAVDRLGVEGEPSWSLEESAWAAVSFGTSAERREAGQQSASQSATFRVLASTVLRGADGTWSIMFDGDRWGITGKPVAVGPQGEELEFTAIRKGD